MPAASTAQQRLFGAALAYKRGNNPDASKKVKEIADSMSEAKLKEYATSVAKEASDRTDFRIRILNLCKEAAKKKKNAAWTRREGQNSEGGLNEKGRKSYERQNPGSNLKAPVSGKVKKGGKASKRRKSFCARSDGQRKMHSIDCSRTPDKRICKARRKWKCASYQQDSKTRGFFAGYLNTRHQPV